MKNENKNIIYHYCSLETFHSIITKKSFWLFSLNSSNDLEEMTEAKKVIDNVLGEEKYKNLVKDKLDTNNSSNAFYNALVKPTENLNLDKSPEFKVMSGVIRKYVELKMDKIRDKQPIKEVILGPDCKTNIDEFNEFLKANDVLCKAVESKIKNRK